jgi:hypothetical protein
MLPARTRVNHDTYHARGGGLMILILPGDLGTRSIAWPGGEFRPGGGLPD